MDLRGHMDTLGVNDSELARAAGLSRSTIVKVKRGRPVNKQAVDWLLEALSVKYGRKIAREEVEGLLVAEEPQA